MTATDWRALAPGRELDAIVAELMEPRASLPTMTVHEARLHAWGPDPKLWTWYSVAGMDSPLGWWYAELGTDCPVGDHEPTVWHLNPNSEPSTDIAAAWLVMDAVGGIATLKRMAGAWYCGFGEGVTAWADTAPMAIVRATLTYCDCEARGEG